MRQANALSSDSTITLTATATQTGTHRLKVYIPGTGVRTASFEATDGLPFVLPNIFPELGGYVFDIEQPDTTYFDDGSGCSMWLLVMVHCGQDAA